jgi:8-oxo-dGTP pyrophosphatase MutT (NUDIX family)
MTQVSIGVVDVYVIRPVHSLWQVLTLQRAAGTRSPSTWETVHGHIEGDELPEHAAIREVHEETGLNVERLYNVTVQSFYLHSINTVELAVVFAAFVKEPATVVLGAEHQQHAWVTVEAARKRFVWPRSRTALDDIVALLGKGDAGGVEDVLRVF